MNAQRIARVVLVYPVLFLLPALAWAQAESGNIAGAVRDASGAVMPGVTVEAASPALIEKVRVVTTDGQGLYRIVDLRPGTYTVTFTLPGLGTVKREGIALTTGFTANVNAELKVGSLRRRSQSQARRRSWTRRTFSSSRRSRDILMQSRRAGVPRSSLRSSWSRRRSNASTSTTSAASERPRCFGAWPAPTT